MLAKLGKLIMLAEGLKIVVKNVARSEGDISQYKSQSHEVVILSLSIKKFLIDSKRL